MIPEIENLDYRLKLLNQAVQKLTEMIMQVEGRLKTVEGILPQLVDTVDTVINKQVESNEVVADALATIRRIEESRD